MSELYEERFVRQRLVFESREQRIAHVERLPDESGGVWKAYYPDFLTFRQREGEVIWRLRRDKHTAHGTIIPHTRQTTLVWWIDDEVQDAEDFVDWTTAVERADVVRARAAERWFGMTSRERPGSWKIPRSPELTGTAPQPCTC